MCTRLLLVGLVAVIWGWLGISRAEALPIVHDQGEEITFLANLPPDAPLLLNVGKDQDRPTKIGYKYWRFRIFWAAVWTSDGEFVAYRSERGIRFQLEKTLAL